MMSYESSALFFTDPEFDGLRCGEVVDRDVLADEPPLTIGVCDCNHDYMVRARMGLTARPEDRWTSPENNFSSIWPEEFEGQIDDPVLAEHAAWAMKPHWEAAMSLESEAAANSDANFLGRGVLTFMGGVHDGLRIGPFMRETQHCMTELGAGMLYESAHKEGLLALQTYLTSRDLS